MVSCICSLARKCDIGAACRDTQEWSALCFAADRGRGDAARALLEAGADPDAPTKEPYLYDVRTETEWVGGVPKKKTKGTKSPDFCS